MKKKIWSTCYLLFWTFIFGSIFGYYYEMGLQWLQRGTLESRQGLIYGPFSQVYGIGAVIFVLLLSRFKKTYSLFLAGTLLGGLAEYICSLIQQYVFGSISWDYSSYFLNFNGRTSLFHMVCWGVIGVLFMKLVYPLLLKGVEKLKNKTGYIISIILGIFLLFDIFISTVATIREKQRRMGIEARNTFEAKLDEWYPDSYLYKIYPNKKDRLPKKEK